MKNYYKLASVFKCKHDTHAHFSSQMSPFHVLEEKKCFPNGCIYFVWKCKLLAKQKRCFRNFRFVGSKCTSCKYFYEEKVHQFPEKNQRDPDFFEKYEEFTDWIESLAFKRFPCDGKISSIRPDLVAFKNGKQININVRGFLVTFDSGFINNQEFEDPFYLRVSKSFLQKYKIRIGDDVEFNASLEVNKGRLVLIKPSAFEIFNRVPAKGENFNDFYNKVNFFRIQEGQPRKCKTCRFGSLVDLRNTGTGPRRILVCLKGVNDHLFCHEYSAANPEGNECANKMKCNHVL